MEIAIDSADYQLAGVVVIGHRPYLYHVTDRKRERYANSNNTMCVSFHNIIIYYILSNLCTKCRDTIELFIFQQHVTI